MEIRHRVRGSVKSKKNRTQRVGKPPRRPALSAGETTSNHLPSRISLFTPPPPGAGFSYVISSGALGFPCRRPGGGTGAKRLPLFRLEARQRAGLPAADRWKDHRKPHGFVPFSRGDPVPELEPMRGARKKKPVPFEAESLTG